MKVRFGGVAAVAATADLGTRGHRVALAHGDAALPQVGEEAVFAVAEVEHDVVAGGMLRIRLADRLVRQSVDDGSHGGVGGREDRPVPAVVGVERLRIAFVAGTGAHDDEIVGEALPGIDGVIVLFQRAAAPVDEPLAVEGQTQARLRPVVEEARFGRLLPGADEEAGDAAVGVEGELSDERRGALLVLRRAQIEPVSLRLAFFLGEQRPLRSELVLDRGADVLQRLDPAECVPHLRRHSVPEGLHAALAEVGRQGAPESHRVLRGHGSADEDYHRRESGDQPAGDRHPGCSTTPQAMRSPASPAGCEV